MKGRLPDGALRFGGFNGAQTSPDMNAVMQSSATRSNAKQYTALQLKANAINTTQRDTLYSNKAN